MSNVEPPLTHIKINQLSTYVAAHTVSSTAFQTRLSKEYLNQLQVRTKWKIDKCQDLSNGVLVLIKDGILSPMNWIIGLIPEVASGNGMVRVATVKTSNGVFKKPATRLCLLPINH